MRMKLVDGFKLGKDKEGLIKMNLNRRLHEVFEIGFMDTIQLMNQTLRQNEESFND